VYEGEWMGMKVYKGVWSFLLSIYGKCYNIFFYMFPYMESALYVG